MSMVGFVDDSTGTYNDFQPQTEANLPELIQKMESDAQLWNNLLYCTGGKLELTKCSFHVLRFEFRPNGTPVATIDSYDDQIHITDLETKNRISIPSKRAFDPHKTLGHYKSPTTKLQTELQNLRQKADRIAMLLCCSPLTRQGAYLAYHTVYNPSIRYTLPQSFFSKAELDKTQASSLHKIIAKCGFNRNTSRAIMFAPVRYGGGGFFPWYLLQGEGQILNFLKHWRTDTLVSKTLKVAVLWAQWQAGHHRSILEDVSSPIPYLECRWITSLREFLRVINGALVVDTPLVAMRERKEDIYIMQYAQTCGLFTRSDLQIINYCRLYLHATTVSELFDASGTQIMTDVFNCRREPWFNPHTIITLQRRPSAYQIKMKWQKLCRQWTTAAGYLGASYTLGKWTTSGQQLRRWREAYAIPDQPDKIYRWNESCYWEYRKVNSRHACYSPVQESNWTPTTLCIPVDASQHTDGTLQVSIPNHLRPVTIVSTPIPITFSQYTRTLQKWEQFFLQGIIMHYSPYELVYQINKLPDTTPLLAVSDGSMQCDTITYGWVFGSEAGSIFAQHQGLGVGMASSHRAEACGMLSVALFVKHVYKFTRNDTLTLNSHSILKFFSDNSGLVNRVTQRLSYSTPFPNSTLAPDWDIVEQITQVIMELPHKEKHIQWVKGHQDDISDDIPIVAKYNVLADELADAAYHSSVTEPRPSIELPAAKCSLYLNDRMIQSHYTRDIRETYTLPPYKLYIARRHDWTDHQLLSIDWDLFMRVTANCSANPVQLSKFLHDKLPTNAEIAKSNTNQTTTCPHCEEPGTFLHLLRCQHAISMEFRSELLDSVATYMDVQDFPPCVSRAFTHCLEVSLRPDTQPDLSRSQSYFEAQVRLGPRSILKGLLSKKWRQAYDIEQTKYTNNHGANSLDIFAPLVRIIWTAQLKLWENYLQTQFSPQQGRSENQISRQAQYQQRIRNLYNKRDQCLPGHRDIYFPTDIDDYINNSTPTQMRQYLHYYEAAIYQSIQAAKNQPLRSLWTFPGFIRQHPTRPHRTEPPTQSTPLTHSQQATGARGAPLHHRHTRWREALSTPWTSIRNFFPSKASHQ